MAASILRKIYSTPSGGDIEICITTPHQFAREQQHLFLPSWDRPLSYLILVLQQSSISLATTTPEVALEKNRLRTNFMDLGLSLRSLLQGQQYPSDLFDPRTGLPLFDNSILVWDDNAAVQALLNYPVISWQNCSLLEHPVWDNQVYPATIATTASLVVILSCLPQLAAKYNWNSKVSEEPRA